MHAHTLLPCLIGEPQCFGSFRIVFTWCFTKCFTSPQSAFKWLVFKRIWPLKTSCSTLLLWECPSLNCSNTVFILSSTFTQPLLYDKNVSCTQLAEYSLHTHIRAATFTSGTIPQYLCSQVTSGIFFCICLKSENRKTLFTALMIMPLESGFYIDIMKSSKYCS